MSSTSSPSSSTSSETDNVGDNKIHSNSKRPTHKATAVITRYNNNTGVGESAAGGGSFLSKGSSSIKQQLSQEGWSHVEAYGEWSENSAGGSWGHETWTVNDQFQLKVLRPCNLVVVLTQISIHLDSPQAIGFYITHGHC